MTENTARSPGPPSPPDVPSTVVAPSMLAIMLTRTHGRSASRPSGVGVRRGQPAGRGRPAGLAGGGARARCCHDGAEAHAGDVLPSDGRPPAAAVQPRYSTAEARAATERRSRNGQATNIHREIHRMCPLPFHRPGSVRWSLVATVAPGGWMNGRVSGGGPEDRRGAQGPRTYSPAPRSRRCRPGGQDPDARAGVGPGRVASGLNGRTGPAECAVGPGVDTRL